MILPGVLSSPMQARPTVRYSTVIGEAVTTSTTIDITTSSLNARVGDLVVFSFVASLTAGATVTNNANMSPLGTPQLTSYKFFDGTEPATIRFTVSGGTFATAALAITVASGLRSFVGSTAIPDASAAVVQITSPARFWIVVSFQSAYTTTVATPPPGYTGYQQNGSTLGARTAYRVADENTQLGGSWTNLPAQAFRRSWAFK